MIECYKLTCRGGLWDGVSMLKFYADEETRANDLKKFIGMVKKEDLENKTIEVLEEIFQTNEERSFYLMIPLKKKSVNIHKFLMKKLRSV